MQFLNIFLRTTHYLENFLIFQLKIFATFFLSIKKKDAICNFVASGEKWKCFRVFYVDLSYLPAYPRPNTFVLICKLAIRHMIAKPPTS